jgi:hypothetical protein
MYRRILSRAIIRSTTSYRSSDSLMESSAIDADYDPCIRQQYFIALEVSDILVPTVKESTRAPPIDLMGNVLRVRHLLSECSE